MAPQLFYGSQGKPYRHWISRSGVWAIRATTEPHGLNLFEPRSVREDDKIDKGEKVQ